jgi:hypothetical protein
VAYNGTGYYGDTEQATAATDVRIGIWGGIRSGKTTFLGALDIAARRATEGGWVLDGIDEEFPGSNDFLVTQTRALRRREFPEPTSAPGDYGFILSGELTPGYIRGLSELMNLPQMAGRIAGLLGRARPVSFTLHVRDYPGGSFIDTVDPHDEIWDYLAGCHGLIYLVDPERELDSQGNRLPPTSGDERNFDYLQRSIKLLRGRMRSTNSLLKDRLLPHYLAVCVTKLDMASVFSLLREADLIERFGSDWPYIRVEDPQAAFELIAEDSTREEIRRAFDPDRVHYFMTSSIGFYADESGRPEFGYRDEAGATHRDDYVNVLPLEDGPRIRGEVRPVNVLEPLIWIYTQHLADQQSGKTPANKRAPAG